MAITISSGMRLTPARLNALFPVVVQKLSDESRASTTTLTADSTLLLPNLVAGSTWEFELMLLWRSAAAGATPGMKVDFTLPAGATMVNPTFHQGSTLVPTNANGVITGLVATTTNGALRLWGLLVQGATVGALTFRWAQNASSASTTTVAAGSWLRAERID
jgi:hypothetical protein